MVCFFLLIAHSGNNFKSTAQKSCHIIGFILVYVDKDYDGDNNAVDYDDDMDDSDDNDEINGYDDDSDDDQDKEGVSMSKGHGIALAYVVVFVEFNCLFVSAIDL